MPPVISELLKFTVAPSFRLASASFASLRRTVAANGAKEQYYGADMNTSSILLWVIQWHADKGPFESPEFRNAVKALDVNETPQRWFLPFAHDSLPRPALTAPVCELCFLHVGKTADKASLAHSLNKTFTDCYYADGFTGGHWSAATNDDNMNYYYLGWESRAHHAAYSKTDLFALEVDKLMPHMDAGGANFVKLTQELN
ncbi:Berberine/berberine-like domain-containing protein [Pleurotus pulmonarius]